MFTRIVTSKGSGQRLAVQKTPLSYSKPQEAAMVEVDPGLTYQTIMGFGGAFTEAAAVTLSKMSADLREEVIEKYYDKNSGLNYNLGRVHIHSCDFALGNYTYVEEGDQELKSFSIDHDRALILPLVKAAMAKRGSDLQILASPWSPPHWMKTNHQMNHGGQLLPDYFSAWAMYYAKFIEAYEAAGVPIWGLTVQNEPAAVQIWDSCIYSAEEERDFVKNHLGPTLVAAGYGDKKLLIWDHNRDVMVQRAKRVLEDPEAAQYVWGTGFHWYVSEAFENVGKVHDLFPDKHLLFTEGCQEGGVHLNAWHTGERYARNMIGDFNNWCEGYLDWNIVLDERGGPNHVNNLCDAPIICDTQENTLIYNSSYYYIGHFSKYVQPGALRIFSDSADESLGLVAFINPDKKTVIVLLNETDEQKSFGLKVKDRYLQMVLEPHTIETLVEV